MMSLVAEWRKMIATVPDNTRLTMFRQAVQDVASHLDGAPRGDAVAELAELALAHSNFGLDQQQLDEVIAQGFEAAEIARADEQLEALWGDPSPKANGKAQQQARAAFKLVPFDQIKLSTERSYLVKGIIPRQGLAVVWGPPKCGKSFWTFDLFMHVALGWLYRGHKVQQGPVVYLALEGGHGFRNRVEAWRRKHLADQSCSAETLKPVPFFLCDVPLDLVADRDRLIGAIKAQLAGQRPVAVVIDTLNRALIGDENKSDDMAKFIRAADLIRSAFACAVVIIHHCGIAGSRPRGHTSLTGADDAQIAIERTDDGVITAKVEHMKDGDSAAPMSCRLERVELGQDEDGDEISSCVVVPIEGTTKTGKAATKLSSIAVAGLRSLQDCLADMGKTPPASTHLPVGVTCVTLAEWRVYLEKHALINRDGGYREQFRRIRVTLKNAGKIGIWDEFVWSVT